METQRRQTSSAPRRRAEASLSRFVDQRLPRPELVAAWLGAALLCHMLIHYGGLHQAIWSEGDLRWSVRVANGLHVTHHVQLIGEHQPLGFLEEMITVVVVGLLVGLLTSAVRQLRTAGASPEDRLPSELWLVALAAFWRPRRVVDEIWRITASLEPTSSRERAPGAVMLDFVWPVWLFTNVAIRIADHVSASSQTLSDLQRGTWMEVVAEIGFLATGLLLLVLAVAIAKRPGVRSAVDSSLRFPSVKATVWAVAVAPLVLGPIAVADLRHAYKAADHGASLSVLRAKLTVQRVWRAREAAASSGDANALRSVDTLGLLQADLAGLARERRARRRTRWEREFQGVSPAIAPGNRTEMLAAVDTFGTPGWDRPRPGLEHELVALVRRHPGGPWQFALEVPFHNWPWPWDRLKAPSSPTHLSPLVGRTLLRRGLDPVLMSRGARRVDFGRVIAVPLAHGRDLACGTAYVHTFSPVRVVQACVAGASSGAPVVLGVMGAGISGQGRPYPQPA